MRRFVIALLMVAAGFAEELPWYMRETAMTPEGRLTFLEKGWWPRAQQLAEGQSFTLDLNGDGRADTLVERRDGHLIETIDGAGAAHVVSLNGTGIVDRMIVYTDNNDDGKADEMEIRHYREGYLRYAWFGENYDRDGIRIFDLKNWSYAGNNASNKFRGNLQIYLNKYDPVARAWAPLSECPFAFGDPNGDGHGEWVVRVSVAPLNSNTGADTDYANNYEYMWAPQATPLAQSGNMNVRLSYNLDPEPRRDPLNRPHYTFGFTMVGAQRYDYPGMFYTNPRRRPPQTVVRIPWNAVEGVALNYPAEKTGFSWDEAREVHRWEGQFWIYERQLLYNTGGPTTRWNMRREFSAKPSRQRQLYYSEVDRRYHLYGASEGWLEVGRLVNQQKDLEIRVFDRDGDGFLDTWEVFEAGSAAPARVSRVSSPRARMVALSREALAEEYNRKILPEAIADNERLIAELKRFASSPLAAAYEQEAHKAASAERRRYCLDIARELCVLTVREALYARNAAMVYPRLEQAAGRRTLELGPVEGRYTVGDTLAYWKLARQIEEFVTAYGEGKLKEAREMLERIGP
jgi:hypothetical protein